MRKIFVMIAAVLAFALVAAATEAPRAEAFLGYNFVRFNPWRISESTEFLIMVCQRAAGQPGWVV